MLNVKLKWLLYERGVSQKELAEMTGLRPNTISEIANNQRSTINREQISIICDALDITDLNELFELRK